MRTELVTTLKRKATELIAEVESARDPILITQHGLPAAYLVDVQTYESLQRRLSLLEGIARGEKAVERRACADTCASEEAYGAMAEVIWIKPALNDLDAIADYIALDDPAAARGLVRRVFKHVEQLIDHPQSGSKPAELRGWRYRQIVEPPCRVFYRHDA